jgi:NADH/NAD ratio-sensing transcriptional regulator Rex
MSKQLILSKLENKGINAEDVKKFDLSSLGWLARIGSGLLFTALNDLVIPKIEKTEIRDVVQSLSGVLEQLVGLLTDSDKNNQRQILEFFELNGERIGKELISKILALLQAGGVDIKGW